ncbi:hypothetical protein U3516DRAFT_811039 [Neocallimastix sp. 'constans']|jgi:hypothetical protein
MQDPSLISYFERQQKFVSLVRDIQFSLNSKEYKNQGYTFNDYIRMRWNLSQAQAYRYLISAKVLDQLEEFKVQPCYERLCRSLYKVAKKPDQIKLLWSTILRKAGGRPDCINSTHVKDIWKELCQDSKYNHICHYEDDLIEKIEKSITKRSIEKKHKQLNLNSKANTSVASTITSITTTKSTTSKSTTSPRTVKAIANTNINTTTTMTDNDNINLKQSLVESGSEVVDCNNSEYEMNVIPSDMKNVNTSISTVSTSALSSDTLYNNYPNSNSLSPNETFISGQSSSSSLNSLNNISDVTINNSTIITPAIGSSTNSLKASFQNNLNQPPVTFMSLNSMNSINSINTINTMNTLNVNNTTNSLYYVPTNLSTENIVSETLPTSNLMDPNQTYFYYY